MAPVIHFLPLYHRAGLSHQLLDFAETHSLPLQVFGFSWLLCLLLTISLFFLSLLKTLFLIIEKKLYGLNAWIFVFQFKIMGFHFIL